MQFFSRSKFSSSICLLGMCGCLLLIAPQISWSAGLTPAGTIISNVATVSYSIGGSSEPPLSSAPALVKVDELINPVITWQDASPVAVNSPGQNDALTFLLTNSGNGQEAFSLARTNDPSPPPGKYTPLNGSIGSLYLESGSLAGFQASGASADTIYVPGTNDPNLPADAGQIIYVISDTPNVASNIQGDVLLSASSLTAGAAGALPGTGLAGLGQGSGFAVVGTTQARASATGSYITSGLGMAITKTVAGVDDQHGSSVLIPGAVMTYQIAVALSGAGTATNLVITDPLPADITYVTGSIAVNGIAKTDLADADNSQFIAASQTISVSLGNVASPANIVITFRATIN